MAENNVQLTDLRVNGLERPLIIDTPQPVFSWRMECSRTGAKQTAYQITVASDDRVLWDSGKTDSDACIAIPYPASAQKLAAEADYRWKVTVWDETGTECSACSRFSTGLMGSGLEAWHGARWIGPGEISFSSGALAVFRIQFRMQISPGGTGAGIIFSANDSLFHSEQLSHPRRKLHCVPAGYQLDSRPHECLPERLCAR